MDLLSTVRKTGSRGGVNFSWDDVATSAHRENYLGHSVKAPVGRWAKGRDLTWYAKSDSTTAANPDETEEERVARERREEIQKIKEAEEEAISRVLGFPITPRNVTGPNAIQVEGSKSKPANRDGPIDGTASKERRREKHGDSERRHRRRERSRDRERDRIRHHSRSRGRRGIGPEEASEREQHSKRRSRSPLSHHHRRRDYDRSRSRDHDRQERRHHSRSRSRERRPQNGDSRRDRNYGATREER